MEYNKVQDLIADALNVAVETNQKNLKSQADVEGVIFLDLFDKPSRFSWCGIGYGELRITIWWGIKKSIECVPPLNKAVELYCSAWLERKDGLWIQGKGKSGLLQMYCSNEAASSLKELPNVEPLEFEKEGRLMM